MERKRPRQESPTAPSFDAFMEASYEYERASNPLATAQGTNYAQFVDTTAKREKLDSNSFSLSTTTSRCGFSFPTTHHNIQSSTDSEVLNHATELPAAFFESSTDVNLELPPGSLRPPAEIKMETYQQLQARCRHLSTQLRTQTQRREAAENETLSSKAKIEEISCLALVAYNKIEEAGNIAQIHAEEMAEMKGDLEAEQGYTTDLRGRYKVLKADYDTLLERAGGLQTRVDVAEPKIVELEKEVKKLKLDRERKEPLVKIGVDIRMRFLELTKVLVLYVNRNRLDNESIEKGNRAAHNAIGEADAALLLIDYLHPKQQEQLTAVFKELYHTLPNVYISMPNKLREAINCQGTILSLQTLNIGINRPVLERQQALEQIDIIRTKFSKLSEEVFNVDVDVNRRLELVKGLTETIVQFDRKREGNADLGRRRDSRYSGVGYNDNEKVE